MADKTFTAERCLLAGCLLAFAGVTVWWYAQGRRVPRPFEFEIPKTYAFARNAASNRLVAFRSPVKGQREATVLAPDGTILQSLSHGLRFNIKVASSGHRAVGLDKTTGPFLALAPVDFNGPITAWRGAAGEEALAWTPDESGIIMRNGNASAAPLNSAYIRQLKTGARVNMPALGRLTESYKNIGQMVFSHDGRKLALIEGFDSPDGFSTARAQVPPNLLGGRGIVASWPELRPLFTLPGHRIRDVAFSADDSVVTAIRYIEDDSIKGTVASRTSAHTHLSTWANLRGLNRPAERLVDDGLFYAGYGEPDSNSIGLWSTQSGRYLGALEPRYRSGTGGPRIELSPRGDSLLILRDGKIRNIDLRPYEAMVKQP